MRRSYRIAGAFAATLAAAAAGVVAIPGSATAATSAKAKYLAALRAAAAQNVHYVSTATEQGISLEVVANTGKTSGSQDMEVLKGSTLEELAVILIGSTGYLRGNEAALKQVVGLTATESATYAYQWLSFPTDNGSLSELVSGIRNSGVASALAMSGPYTLGGTKVIAGHLTLAIKGTANTSSGSKVPIVLYVESGATPRPVREVTNPNANRSATVTFSNWGETTHPTAPAQSVPLVPLLPAG